MPVTSVDLDNYTATYSLNERTIYIKFVDKTSFMCYEGNFDSKEFRVSYDLPDIYTIINNCFQKSVNDYNFEINVNNGAMKIQFSAKIGGFLKTNFEIILREKLMANDSQLSLNFNRLEQKQEQMIKTLTQRLDELERILTAVSFAEITIRNQVYFKINSIELSLTANGNDWSKIKLFYQLEKLTCNNCPDLTTLTQFSNNTLKEFIYHGNGSSGLHNILDIHNFPNLEKLTIHLSPNLSNMVNVLASTKHKITHITIKSCKAVNNTEMITYCQTNNIKLDLS